MHGFISWSAGGLSLGIAPKVLVGVDTRCVSASPPERKVTLICINHLWQPLPGRLLHLL